MRFGWRARDLFGLIRRVEARSLRKGVARHHGVSLHGERSFEEQVKVASVAPAYVSVEILRPRTEREHLGREMTPLVIFRVPFLDLSQTRCIR
jgi:hypothetical protein